MKLLKSPCRFFGCSAHGSQIHGIVECTANSSQSFFFANFKFTATLNKISVAVLYNRQETQHTISHQCSVDIRFMLKWKKFCISEKWSNCDIIKLSSLSYYCIFIAGPRPVGRPSDGADIS